MQAQHLPVLGAVTKPLGGPWLVLGSELGLGSWCEGDDTGVLSTFLLPLVSQLSPPPLPHDKKNSEKFQLLDVATGDVGTRPGPDWAGLC